MASLLISISRTALSLSPLVLSGTDDSNPLGIANYTEPGRQSRVTYMPDSRYSNGSESLGSSLQQGQMSFEVFPTAVSEQASRNLLAELKNAVTAQRSFAVTVTISDATPEVWQADPGSVMPIGGRTVLDLHAFNPTWVVTIPVYPVAS